MNEHLRPPSHLRRRPESTRAADGLPRCKWTAQEVAAMLEAGIIDEDDRFELVGGELIEMAAKGNRHERLRHELGRFWFKRCPDDVLCGWETPLRLGVHDEPEPEFFLYSARQQLDEVRGDAVLLVVEIADTSLGYDSGHKARLYTSFGAREYWVINAQTLETTAHREPDPAGYTSIVKTSADQQLVPLLAPALAVRLADFDMG